MRNRRRAIKFDKVQNKNFKAKVKLAHKEVKKVAAPAKKEAVKKEVVKKEVAKKEAKKEAKK